MSTSYQDYSSAQKAEVLAMIEANGGNIQRTARETGIPHQTIRRWTENPERFSALQNEKRRNLADLYEEIAEVGGIAALQRLKDNPDLIPYGQLMTGNGIAVDKSQLLKGLPTSIHAEVERQELVVILQSALNAGIEQPAIDALPETDLPSESP